MDPRSVLAKTTFSANGRAKTPNHDRSREIGGEWYVDRHSAVKTFPFCSAAWRQPMQCSASMAMRWLAICRNPIHTQTRTSPSRRGGRFYFKLFDPAGLHHPLVGRVGRGSVRGGEFANGVFIEGTRLFRSPLPRYLLGSVRKNMMPAGT